MSAQAWSAVTSARRSLPEFILPAAHALGALAPGGALPHAPVWAALRGLLADAVTDRDARMMLMQQVERALAHWPAAPAETDATSDPLDTPQTHDDYFRIGRCAGDAAAGVIGGIGRGFALLLDEVHESGELPEYLGLAETLLALWSFVWPGASPEDRTVLGRLAQGPAGVAAPLRQRATDPLRRWLRGHHVFAVLTQGMVCTLEELPAAVAAGEGARTESLLLSLAALYRASAVAFRFSADFDPAVYAEVLRPTMCEPYMPKGFSGTLSSDHAMLVARLTELRTPLAAAQAACPAAYARMRHALGEVYDNHRWVCERFDGAKVPSLRTSSASGEAVAVEMLDRFRARRLEMLR